MKNPFDDKFFKKALTGLEAFDQAAKQQKLDGGYEAQQKKWAKEKKASEEKVDE